MFQVREKNPQWEPGQKICLPELRKQDFLQAEDESKKNKGDLTWIPTKSTKCGLSSRHCTI